MTHTDACITFERVKLSLPPTVFQRVWQDMSYWTLTGLRFVWGLVRYGAYCATHPLRWWKWRQIQALLGRDN